MATPIITERSNALNRFPFWLGTCVFAAIALFFLWEEHQAHIMGALPYVLLLLCPAMHLFMHRGHGGRGRSQGDSSDGAHAAHGRSGAES